MSKTPLSNIITIDNLPEQLSFISDGLNTVFDNLYYSDLEVFEDHRWCERPLVQSNKSCATQI